MANTELHKLIEIIDTLSPNERDELARYLTGQSVVSDVGTDEVGFTEDEIKEMMTIRPASGHEIVSEGIKSGAIGSWADMGIDDPVEWLAQQRKKRYQW